MSRSNPDPQGPPRSRRWVEQRWLVDNIIRANGIDWDQPRSAYLSAPCGVEANADFAAIRQRVQKFADASPAFEATAKRREAKARAAEAAGERVTARENFFMAAVHWGAAQWPIDENNEQNLGYNERKRACYTSYAGLADHRVEAVWIPFRDKALSAWLHLPPGHSSGRIPAVVSIPGMDSFKEISVSLHGVRWLLPDMAVLAIDGPGQYESAVLGIPVSVPAWAEAGPAGMDWLPARAQDDPRRGGGVRGGFGAPFSPPPAGAPPPLP